MFELVQSKKQGRQYLPSYHSNDDLRHVENILKSQAPLVFVKEINHFRRLVARAAVGEYFLMQLGDCAESFYECDKDTTHAKLAFIQQISEFFHKKTGANVIPVGRIAGQYVRSKGNLYETIQHERIYSYFGDMVNQFHKEFRTPDPWRMLLSYNCAASIYRELNQWNRDLKPEKKIYTSHESLLLNYEQALTRWDKRTGLYYNLSTYFPWLGNRTVNSIQHINYLKKVANPIAVKIGPDISIKDLIKTLNKLDPNYLPGRITLIPRLGVENIHCILPQLIEAVKKTHRTVLWSCDPMHGNTKALNSGIKIRKLSDIVNEIKDSFLIHRKMGSQLNALHLEATYQDVRECIDYPSSCYNLALDFGKYYNNLVDPRLNFAQTIHIIQQAAKYYRKD